MKRATESPVLSQGEFMTFGDFVKLSDLTYFSAIETEAIYSLFSKAAAPNKELNQPTFYKLYPNFSKDPRIQSSLFKAINKSKNGYEIEFPEFLQTLGIMCRGNAREKAELALEIINYNKDPKIDKKEIADFCKAMQTLIGLENADSLVEDIIDEIIHSNVEGNENDIKKKNISFIISNVNSSDSENDEDPEEIEKNDELNSEEKFFKKKASFKKKSINWEKRLLDNLEDFIFGYYDFQERARTNPTFTSCFGFFPFIYNDIFRPIEEKLSVSLDMSLGFPTREGTVKVKDLFKTAYCKVLNGVLTLYKDQKHFLEYQKRWNEKVSCKPPIYVIELSDSSCISKQKNSFEIRGDRKLEFECEEKDRDYWISCINLNRYVGSKFHPHLSFAPIRVNTPTHIYTTGGEYFPELARCLKQAKTEILITGWFISPKIYLNRKKENGQYVDRFDQILAERAKSGVKVRILVWDEIDAAFSNGSKECKDILEKLSSNIKVIRDPLQKLTIYSHHQKTCVIDQTVAFVGGIDIGYNRFEDFKFSIVDEEKDQIYPGRMYVNPMIEKKNKNVGDPLKDVWNRKKVPRMPWMDYQTKVIGESARDIARNFIQRWTFARGKYPFVTLRETDYDLQSIVSVHHQDVESAKVQVLRSVSKWSFNLTETEHSIYRAQLKAIEESKHFIYIENQFFISSCAQTENPKNKIIDAIVKRIAKAIDQKEKFRVIFVVPLHSSSPLNSKILQQLMYWQHSSMFRGKTAMLNVLKEDYPHIDDIEDYVTITSLRNWGMFQSGVICNEMIYVHSKLMIVDDKIVFCSSANINDRSMEGDRDSEIGVRIEGDETVNISMGGKKFKGTKIAHDLRVKTFSKFTGKTKEEVEDPIEFYPQWRKIAESNRDIYVDVFQKTVENLENPDSSDVKIIQQYSHKLKARNVEKLPNIQGFIVPYPKNFLSKGYSQPNERDPLANFYT
eukprot:gene2671-3867_t